MTSSTQSEEAASPSDTESAPTAERPKKRKKKRRKKAELERAPVAAPPSPGDKPGLGRAVAFLLIAVGAALFYVLAAPADNNRPFALVTVGVAAFLCGASPGIDPQRSVPVFGALVAVGLAIVGIRPSEIGTVLAMGGGLGLGGGIHRLGRLGPDEGTSLARSAAKPLRRAAGS